MKNIEVTVIVPTYNSEKHIKRCLDSLLNQSFSNYEIIVINDGSTDNTGSIVEQYADQYSNLRYYVSENGGVSNARNIGIKKAYGQYIGFVDSDDFVEKKYLEKLVEGIKINGCDLSSVSFTSNDYVGVICNDEELFSVINQLECLNKTVADKQFSGYLWNKLFKKTIIDKYHLKFDVKIKIWEDMLFCVLYEQHIRRAAYTNCKLYHYIQYTNSAIHSELVWRKYTQINAIQKIYKISKKYPYDSVFCKRVRNLYSEQLMLPLTDKTYLEQVGEKKAKKIIKKIKAVGGNISFKHRVRLAAYTILPFSMWKYF